jgi:hypothetical protein
MWAVSTRLRHRRCTPHADRRLLTHSSFHVPPSWKRAKRTQLASGVPHGTFIEVSKKKHPPSRTDDYEDRPSVIYWDDYDGGDFSLVQEGWEEENIAPIHALIKAVTWGEARSLTLPGWLERLVEGFGDDREEAPTDDAPFHISDMGFDFGWLFECMVVPWDLEGLLDWFPEWDMDIIEEHCAVGGASPGGHIDTYTPRDTEALLTALRARGYQVEHREFLRKMEDALNLLCA